MPRKTPNLKTRTSRARLAPRTSAYSEVLAPGRALGYRLQTAGQPGKWVLRTAVEGSAKYQQVTLGTADDAQPANGIDVLSYTQALEAALAHTDSAGGRIRVSEALTDWARAKAAEGGSVATARGNANMADAIARQFPATATLETLKPGQIEAWKSKAETRPQRASFNRNLAVLKAALNRAARLHQYDGSRGWDSVKPFPAKASYGKREAFLTVEEEDRLEAAACDDLKPLIRATRLTGARTGELTSLRVRDVHGGHLTLRGKTGERTIPLGEEAAAFFTEAAAGRDPDEVLFRRADGSSWADGRHSSPIRDAVKAAGLDPAVTHYVLRHSFISRKLAEGVPATAVAQFCGTSLGMLQRNYARFVAEQMAGWFA